MWKVTSNKQTSTEISELLESDDELPESYDEVPDIPAYQNDQRFDGINNIQFEWLHKKLETTTILSEISNVQSPAQDYTSAVLPIPQPGCIQPCSLMKVFSKLTLEEEKYTKILISKGILTKRDIFFIKCIEEYSSDTTLLWFIDFLKLKAVQPLQRSCLVGDITNDHYTVAKEPISDCGMRYYLNIVSNEIINGNHFSLEI